MKKSVSLCCAALLILFLCHCHSNKNEALLGIWKLDVINMNGTAIQGNTLGNWQWEFDGEDGYVIRVAETTEKGTYKLDKEKLTLTSVTNKERPEQTYSIVKLDSVSLLLKTVSEKNKTSLSFIKVKKEEK